MHDLGSCGDQQPRPDRQHILCAALQGPFTYEALRPEEINFVPLKQKKTYQSRQLLEVTSCFSSLIDLGACQLRQSQLHLLPA